VQPSVESAEPWPSAETSTPGETPVGSGHVLAAPAGEAGDADDDLFEDAREGEADGLGHEVSDGEAEDAAPKRSAADPGRPSQLEVEEHEVDHCPFRSWCEECVKGRGAGEPHRTVTGERTAIFSFDYLYLTKGLSARGSGQRRRGGR
jgi:hypothetical protein